MKALAIGSGVFLRLHDNRRLWGASGEAGQRQFAVEYNRREPARRTKPLPR